MATMTTTPANVTSKDVSRMSKEAQTLIAKGNKKPEGKDKAEEFDVDKNAKGVKQHDKKDKKEPVMTRTDALAIVLKDEKIETVKEWIDKANKLYGKANDREAKTIISYITKALKVFDIKYPTT